MLLNDVKIRNAKAGAKNYKLSDGDGMYLLVHTNGSKYWRFKYRFAGKEKLLAFGVYPEVSLADARERRATARKAIAAGNDPLEVKKEAKRLVVLNSENTFESIAREWHEANLHTWSTKHGANVIKRLEGDIFPKLGKRPIAELNAPELLSALRVVEKRGALDLTRTIAQYCGRIFAYKPGPTSRKGLIEDPQFFDAFQKAKMRVRKMEFRYVVEPDPIKQALLEIYCAVVLGTPYNSFKTS